MQHAIPSFLVVLSISLAACSAVSAQSWTEPSVSGPGQRGNASVVFDEQRGVTVLYGGSNATQTFDDTWEFDGATWAQVATTGPSYRSSPAVAYDSIRGVMVLFGGVDSNGYFEETWEWNGSVWTQVPVSGPPSRVDAAMGFDPVRGICVLHGGERHLPWVTEFQDTWEYDGISWTQNFGGGLAHREKAAMAWDGVNQRLLLAGGWALNSFSTIIFDSVYAFDGVSWSYAGTMPAKTTLHGMLWDPRAQKVVVHGGWNTFSTNRTMEYDGSTWSIVAPVAGTLVPARYSFGWVHDARRGVNLMYGGRNLSGSSYSWFDATREYLPTKTSGSSSLTADLTGVSLALGGSQTLSLDAGASHAGEAYVMAATASGIWPGTPYGGFLIPLVSDGITSASLANPHGGPLSGFAGVLGTQGEATATLTFPAGGYASMIGKRIHTAFVAFDSAMQPVFVSEAEALDLLP